MSAVASIIGFLPLLLIFVVSVMTLRRCKPKQRKPGKGTRRA